MLKDRVAELKAIRDQVRADAPHVILQDYNSPFHSLLPRLN
jgi:hypothetical protein